MAESWLWHLAELGLGVPGGRSLGMAVANRRHGGCARFTGWKPVAHTIFSLILQRIAVIDPMEVR
jgi:hypothetical protein